MVISNLAILICAVVALVVISTFVVLSRYRKCRPDEILIKYGRTGKDGAAKIITGGGAFIWPIIHSYATMSLRPVQLQLDIKEAAAKGMIRTNVPTNISVVISNEPDLQQIAVKRLLGMSDQELRELIKETIYGQVRMVIARMSVEELNGNRDKFSQEVEINVNNELKKYGLELKTINIQDIRDNAKIIDNLGEQAKAEADKIAQVNIATQKREKMIQVAEQQRIEEATVANTNKEKEIAIAETERDRDTAIADAERDRETAVAKAQAEKEASIAEAEAKRDVRNAEAIKTAKLGENKAAEAIAKSQAELAVVQAEAIQKKGEADAVAAASVKRRTEEENQKVEAARAKKVEAALRADEIVPAEIARNKVEIEADAVAEKAKREAKGQADAILLKAKAEAEAIRLKGEAEGAAKAALLKADADNFTQMLEASQTHPEIAVQFKMVDNYVKIAEAQAEAYQNLKLGDVKVYGNADTAGDFMSKLMGSIAPVLDITRSMPLPGKLQDALAEHTNVNNNQESLKRPKSPKTTNVTVQDVKFEDPA